MSTQRRPAATQAAGARLQNAVEASPALVNALVDDRRGRLRALRRANRGKEIVIFPPSEAEAADQAAGKEGEQSSETDRGAHILCRLLAGVFVVSLCNWEGPHPADITRPNHADGQAAQAAPIDVVAALRLMRSEITFQPSLLLHRFHSRIHDQRPPSTAQGRSLTAQAEATALALESSTLTLWLFPRLLCAAATLLARYPDDQTALAARTEMLELLQLLATLGLEGDGAEDVRLCLLDALRASLDALASAGRPVIDSRASFPIKLIMPPDEAQDDASSRSLRFFALPLVAGTNIASATLPQSGDGIVRTWAPEDFATFCPPLPREHAVPMAHALLQTTALLTQQLAARHPAQLSDLASTVSSLFLDAWSIDDAATGVFFETLPSNLCSARLELAALALQPQASSSPTVRARFSARVAHTLEACLSRASSANDDDDADLIDEKILTALRKAVKAWREGVRKNSAWRPAIASVLLPLAAGLVADVLVAPSVEEAGTALEPAEKRRLDATLLRKSSVFHALLALLEARRDGALPITSGEAERLRSEVLGPALGRGESQNLDDLDLASAWLTRSELVSLREALDSFVPAPDAQTLKRKRHDDESQPARSQQPVWPAEPSAASPVTSQDINEIIGGKAGWAGEKIGNVSLAIATLRRVTAEQCLAAGTLTRTSRGLRCSSCDAPSFSAASLARHGKATAVPLLNVICEAFVTLPADAPTATAALAAMRSMAAHANPEDVCKAFTGRAVRIFELGLKHPERAARLATGRLISSVVDAFFRMHASDHDALRKELAPILALHQKIVNGPSQGNLKAIEAAYLSLGLLARVAQEDVQHEVLLVLVLHLSVDQPLRSLVYLQITQLAAYHGKTSFQLLAPSLGTISAQVVQRMLSAPTLFEEVLNLLNQDANKFLQTTLQHTLPPLIAAGNDKLLRAVAAGVNQQVQAMCFSHVPAILKRFLLLPKGERQASIDKLVHLLRGTADREITEVSVRMLFKSYKPQLLGHLITHLGDPAQHAAALDGLHFFESMRPERGNNVGNQKAALSSFLKEDILEILAWINDELAGAHGKTTVAQKVMTARSIGALVDVVGQTISMVTPQIMATLNTTMQVNELMLPTLESWRTFITKLRYEDVAPFIGQTGAALISAWPRFGRAEKEIAKELVRYIVIDSRAEFEPQLLAQFPNLDSIGDDMPEESMRIRKMQGQAPEASLARVLDRAASENSSVSLQGLQELKRFFTLEREYIARITTGDSFAPMVGKIVGVLFTASSRTGDSQTDIRDLCFETLGMLGAVDPDRFDLPSEDQTYIVLHNFTERDEAIDFGVHLIRHTLVSAFRASEDTKHQAALAYAIQELLKYCGFTSALLVPSATKPVSLKVRQRWNELPTEMLDTIAPLLDSKYSAHLGEPTPREKPIYRHSKTYREWIQNWANELILNASGGDARAIFGVLRSVIRDHDLTIAQHILPHLVLNALISGTEEQRSDVLREIAAILEDQVTPAVEMDEDQRLLSAQTVFGLLDHISLWMRRKNEESSRGAGGREAAKRGREMPYEAAMMNVREIVEFISDELMAQAALKCKAYARSLLNFEKRVRSMRSEGRKDADMQEYFENMHYIYANLDEPDGMEGVSTRVIAPSLEHQIREHESTGRWTSAQSCWEVELQRKPSDPELHIGLLRCLRNLGHYDTMRTHIRGVLSVHPEWDELLAPFNVEGACILSDWSEVRRALQNGSQQSAAHATARVVLALKDRDELGMASALRDARRLVGKPIVAAGKGSYARVYEAVTQLHMVNELELIQSKVQLRNKPGGQVSAAHSLREVDPILLARLNATLPSFRTREPLLSLRRSAFAAVYDGDTRALGASVGQAWILTAKSARRAGHFQTAYSAVLQAMQCEAPFAFIQRAKLLALDDKKQTAIQELNNAIPNIATAMQAATDAQSKRNAGASAAAGVIDLTADEDSRDLMGLGKRAYARAHLLRARLVDETGRYPPNEVIERYKTTSTIDPGSEKLWYRLGHYYDSQKETPVANLMTQSWSVCRYYLKSAQCGTKYFYRTLPRVLTVWLDSGDDPYLINVAKKQEVVNKTADPDGYDKVEQFGRIIAEIRKAQRRLRPYQWLAVFPQLVSRVVHKHVKVWETLAEIVAMVVDAYPHQAMWSMIAGSQSKDAERKRRFNEVVSRVKSQAARDNKDTARIVDQSQRMARELLYLCDFPVKRETQLNMPSQFPKLQSLADGNLILPLQSSINVSLPSNHLLSGDHQPFADNLPRITGFDPVIDIMPSLQKPRKVVIIGSDGKRYAFLCKPKDDLRKDARLMEFDSMINKLLQADSESRRRRLYIRTYAVVTLNEECGLIEWVPNTIGLRHILSKLYAARGIPLYTTDIKVNMEEARTTPRRAGEIFEARILSRYPSVFHEWFLATFPEPTVWLKARLAYGHTLAVMSMVGYVLGLGDRHGENILFDSSSGDTVHVDLNCLFEKGLTFDVPERVPFRLTHNLVDALGVTGVDGVFRRAAEISMRILRDNKDSLLSVLEAMVHDPLVEWGSDDRSKARQNRPDPRVVEARKSLAPITKKLDGLVRKRDMDWTPPCSVNNAVDALIRDATSSTLLAQMYVGWASYL